MASSSNSQGAGLPLAGSTMASEAKRLMVAQAKRHRWYLPACKAQVKDFTARRCVACNLWRGWPWAAAETDLVVHQVLLPTRELPTRQAAPCSLPAPTGLACMVMTGCQPPLTSTKSVLEYVPEGWPPAGISGLAGSDMEEAICRIGGWAGGWVKGGGGPPPGGPKGTPGKASSGAVPILRCWQRLALLGKVLLYKGLMHASAGW